MKKKGTGLCVACLTHSQSTVFVIGPGCVGSESGGGGGGGGLIFI